MVRGKNMQLNTDPEPNNPSYHNRITPYLEDIESAMQTANDELQLEGPRTLSKIEKTFISDIVRLYTTPGETIQLTRESSPESFYQWALHYMVTIDAKPLELVGDSLASAENALCRSLDYLDESQHSGVESLIDNLAELYVIAVRATRFQPLVNDVTEKILFYHIENAEHELQSAELDLTEYEAAILGSAMLVNVNKDGLFRRDEILLRYVHKEGIDQETAQILDDTTHRWRATFYLADAVADPYQAQEYTARAAEEFAKVKQKQGKLSQDRMIELIGILYDYLDQ